MQISSSSFANGAFIPKLHTCEGAEQSPPLGFKNIPPNAKSLALIVDDPDAKPQTFVHWVAWNIDPATKELKGHLGSDAPETLLMQGHNGTGHNGYKGPCPPSGVHEYFFKLYALDVRLNLPKTATKQDLLTAMQGHVIGQAELMGKYEKGR